jgi:predicted acyl esterase
LSATRPSTGATSLRGTTSPRNAQAGGANQTLPVIVSVHGGPEGQERPGFNPTYQYFLSRGYAVLAPNVRGSTGYGKTYTHLDDVKLREDSVKDLAAAVDWLKTSGGADARRIAVMGGSYGGYMTLAAITLYPDLWAAAIEMFGISNFETNLRNTSGYRRKQREREYGTLANDLEFLRSVSPIYKVDRIKAPASGLSGQERSARALHRVRADRQSPARPQRARRIHALRRRGDTASSNSTTVSSSIPRSWTFLERT